MLRGAWNDTGVAMMNTRPHMCQCLEQRLPGQLHSLSLHVTADEYAVHVHGGQTVRINGEFSWPWDGIDWIEMRTCPVKRHLVVVDAFAIAFSMLTLLWVAYGMSNYREVRDLWQLQRHAFVHHHKFNVERVGPVRRVWWPVALSRKIGLLYSPPVLNGWFVEPVVGSAPVPDIGYFKSFVAWRAYTSPRQLHVELGLLAAE